MYPEQIVIPMKEELTENGFTELVTGDEVDKAIAEEGTALVFIEFGVWLFSRHCKTRSFNCS